ncbi:hypothetical protein LP7551_03885 [Roseibium album]|nr:hypothetical protein LP7551_03885 [Roseibium album]
MCMWANETRGFAGALFSLTVMCSSAQAQDALGEPGRGTGDANPLNNVYFGEQHLHTSASPDAFAFGTRNTADDAYRYAKGEAIKNAQTGDMIQKRTPYDWAAVTDHAEYLGMMPLLLDPDSPLKDTEIGKLIASGDTASGEQAFQQIITSATINQPIDYLVDPKIATSAWQKQIDAAEKHYEPGRFTTLVAFEWSSQPNSKNLHHNVFFRDSGPERVFSAFDSVHREDLWVYQEYQRAVGHENMSIPHNSNVSNSAMFALHDSNGNPIDRRWADKSQRNTPAVEIVQTKGASETHPALSPNDEFAGFETKFTHLLGSGGVLGLIDKSYVRNALIDGVGFQEMIGINPFKYGIVGGGDSHIAASVNEEFNYPGVHGNTDKTPEVRLASTGSVAGEPALFFGTPGATGVWAPENTREAIFDAIKRKETYGTSGTLIRLRFFGGWDFADDLVDQEDFVAQAYDRGVPMGGDLPEKPEAAEAPTFAVWALKDPESGNLDRIQIVKGWYDKRGYGFQKIHNVIWSDQDTRLIDEATGKLPPVGNTVDVSTAAYTNDIGATQLRTVWTDPDFDPTQHAVYYVRVLEIPTPRWSTYDAAKLGIAPPPDVPATIQERAWSSPVWYTPAPELVSRLDFYPGLQEKLPASGFGIGVLGGDGQ